MGIKKYMNLGLTVWIGAMLLSACSNGEVNSPVNNEPSVCFELSRTNGDGSAGDFDNKLLRVLIAERSVEHTSATDRGLYCALDKRFFLEPGTTEFIARQLKLQWYKFVFLGVPNVIAESTDDLGIDGQMLFSDIKSDKESEDATTKDFNKLFMDYSSVLEYQKYILDKTESSERLDLNLYRGVANLWAERPSEDGSVPSETVSLKPITGELMLDMGVLQDQFEREVKSIKLQLKNIPEKVYVYDDYKESGGDIIPGGESGHYPIDSESNVYVYDFKYREYEYDCPEELWNDRQKHCILKFNLLPCNLTDSRLQIIFGENDIAEYPIYSDGSGTNSIAVEIKPNVRTTLLFNGMHKGEFEVRYAGFNENAVIDVDDEWNGWSEQTDGGE